MFKFSSYFDLEKKLVFLINFFLVITMIMIFLFDYSISYFFYFNIILTIILGYIYFKKSKKVSKTLILTNMFIFFYFLYPLIASYLTMLFGRESYTFILFYTILLSYVFLYLSGKHKIFFGNLKKMNYKLLFSSFLIGLTFGVLFFLIKEPVPSIFVSFIENGTVYEFFKYVVFSSLIIAISEQMIFSGFLYNSYKELTTKFDATIQVSIIFLCFHLLRFDQLVKNYFSNFSDFYILFIASYYILLFLFMICAIYFYSFKSKKYDGNFTYPVLIHFGADLGLITLYTAHLFL